MRRRPTGWSLAALLLGVLFLILGFVAASLASASESAQAFGIPLGNVDLFLIAGGLAMLVVALIGAVGEARSQ